MSIPCSVLGRRFQPDRRNDAVAEIAADHTYGVVIEMMIRIVLDGQIHGSAECAEREARGFDTVNQDPDVFLTGDHLHGQALYVGPRGSAPLPLRGAEVAAGVEDGPGQMWLFLE